VLERTAAAGVQTAALEIGRAFVQLSLGNVRGVQIDSAADGIRVRAGQLYMLASVTGTPTAAAVRCRSGSLVSMAANPYGDPVALDYDVGNGSPVNKSFFAASGNTLAFFAGAGADGSTITRI
jgi:hypothetical protein